MSEGNNAVLSSGIVIVGPLQVLVVGTKCGMIKDCYNYPFNDTTNEVSCSTWCKVPHFTGIIAEIVLILRCNISYCRTKVTSKVPTNSHLTTAPLHQLIIFSCFSSQHVSPPITYVPTLYHVHSPANFIKTATRLDLEAVPKRLHSTLLVRKELHQPWCQ